jgi:hypothetical protein
MHTVVRGLRRRMLQGALGPGGPAVDELHGVAGADAVRGARVQHSGDQGSEPMAHAQERALQGKGSFNLNGFFKHPKQLKMT